MTKIEIPYGKQFINRQDIKEVVRALKGKFITTGDYVDKFETAIKKKFGSKFAVTCSSATAGLHLAYMAIDVKKDDVILMPAINFISSFRLAKLMKAKIYLVDVDSNTGQMTYDTILECVRKNKLKKVKAIVSMYLGGYVENNLDFYKLKRKLNCYLIEDACHAIGSKYKYLNKFYEVGSCKHSDLCVFSFHPVKTITTGEGGVVLTNNKKFAEKLKIFRSHGIKRKKNYWSYDIKNLGFNYRLSDINCALGLSQLKKIDNFFKKRKNIFEYYQKKLQIYKEYVFLPKVKNSKNLYHLFLFGLNFKKIKNDKSSFITYLNKKKIFPQFHYIPIFKFSFYKGDNQRDFSGSNQYFNNFLSLPVYYEFKQKHQEYVINCIIEYLKKNIK